MSDTPRTDSAAFTAWDGQNYEAVPIEFARGLERELRECRLEAEGYLRLWCKAIRKLQGRRRRGK